MLENPPQEFQASVLGKSLQNSSPGIVAAAAHALTTMGLLLEMLRREEGCRASQRQVSEGL